MQRREVPSKLILLNEMLSHKMFIFYIVIILILEAFLFPAIIYSQTFTLEKSTQNSGGIASDSSSVLLSTIGESFVNISQNENFRLKSGFVHGIFSPVTQTDLWSVYYSQATQIDNSPVQRGDIIKVYDSDNVLCGIFKVVQNGYYGPLYVFGDDNNTILIDEGAEEGDTLRFTINNYLALPVNREDVIWFPDEGVVNLDLEAKQNWAPRILNIPDQVISEGNTFEEIKLDNYVEDLDGNITDVSWNYTSQNELEVYIDQDRVLIVSPPDDDWYGDEELILVASDNGGASDRDTVKFIVKPVNDNPELSNIPDIFINEDDSTTVLLSDYVFDVDTDIEFITFDAEVISAQPQHPTGLKSNIIKRQTGNVFSHNRFLNLSVNKYKRAGKIVITVGVNDLIILIDNDEKNASVKANSDSSGIFEVVFIATDDSLGFDTDTTTIVVNPQNDPPVIISSPIETAVEDIEYIYKVDVMDIDKDDSIKYVLMEAPDFLTIDSLSGLINGIPGETDVGSHYVSVFVQDKFFAKDSQNYNLEVRNVNDAPIISEIPDQVILEGEIFSSINLDEFVYDPDDLTNSIQWNFEGNLELEIDIDTNRVVLVSVPFEDWNGNEEITFFAFDKGGLYDQDTVLFSVLPVNDVPLITGLPETIIIRSDSSYMISLWDFVSDVETPDSLLTYDFSVTNDSIVTEFDKLNGELKISSKPLFAGSEVLIITVTDDSSAFDSDSISVVVDLPTGIDLLWRNRIPKNFELEQNYPNPFNPQTKIRFGIPRMSHVIVEIFDISGQLIRTLIKNNLSPGFYEVIWEGNNNNGYKVQSGVYIYTLRTEDKFFTRKL
ncbi:T9SS type A sorting domain-containing protein, partial [Bacteroidota bacterium]